MARRAIFIGLLIFGLAVAIGLSWAPTYIEKDQNRVVPHTPYALSAATKELHASLLIGDLHSDSLLWHRDLSKRANHGHVDLPRLQAGNVAIQVFPAVTKSPKGQNYAANTGDTDNITALAMIQRWPPRTWDSLTERALFQARRLHALETVNADELVIVRTSADLEAVLTRRQDDRQLIAALLAFEGAHALDGNLENVERLYVAGYRMMGLHHFFDNKLGGSLHGMTKDGLTEFGKDVVREIERAGAIVDVSHSSEASVDDVLELATRPIVVSHTGFQGVCDRGRNISDDHMKRIAENGGLIGVGYWDGAVCDITPSGIVRNIRYGIDLVGVEHIALGSDYDGSTTVMFDTSEIAILTQTMLNEGFSEAEIRAVMGENLARFLLENLPSN